MLGLCPSPPGPLSSSLPYLLFIIHIHLSSLMFWSPHWIFSFWILYLFKNFISSEVAQQAEAQATVYMPEPEFKTDKVTGENQFWAQSLPPRAHMHLPTHKINEQINISIFQESFLSLLTVILFYSILALFWNLIFFFPALVLPGSCFLDFHKLEVLVWSEILGCQWLTVTCPRRLARSLHVYELLETTQVSACQSPRE